MPSAESDGGTARRGAPNIIIIIIYKENARARGYDLLGPAYLGGQGFGYGGRCEEEVV